MIECTGCGCEVEREETTACKECAARYCDECVADYFDGGMCADCAGDIFAGA